LGGSTNSSNLTKNEKMDKLPDSGKKLDKLPDFDSEIPISVEHAGVAWLLSDESKGCRIQVIV